MRIVPYEPWHLLSIEVQPAQRMRDSALHDPDNARALGEAGPAFTALDDGDTPMAIAGVVDRGPGRAVAWAVLCPTVLRRFGAVHRAVKNFIELQNYRRLETMIDPRHAAAVRWAVRLGFEREGTCRSYAPDGSDMDLYARVR